MVSNFYNKINELQQFPSTIGDINGKVIHAGNRKNPLDQTQVH